MAVSDYSIVKATAPITPVPSIPLLLYNGRRVPERAILSRGVAPDLASVRVADGCGERRRVDRRGGGARRGRARPRRALRIRPPLDRARATWLPGDRCRLQRDRARPRAGGRRRGWRLAEARLPGPPGHW